MCESITDIAREDTHSNPISVVHESGDSLLPSFFICAVQLQCQLPGFELLFELHLSAERWKEIESRVNAPLSMGPHAQPRSCFEGCHLLRQGPSQLPFLELSMSFHLKGRGCPVSLVFSEPHFRPLSQHAHYCADWRSKEGQAGGSLDPVRTAHLFSRSRKTFAIFINDLLLNLPTPQHETVPAVQQKIFWLSPS